MLDNVKTLSYLSDICVCSICMEKILLVDASKLLIMVTTSKGLGCGRRDFTFYFTPFFAAWCFNLWIYHFNNTVLRFTFKKKRSSKESVRSPRDWETCCSIKYSDQNRHHLKKWHLSQDLQSVRGLIMQISQGRVF